MLIKEILQLLASDRFEGVSENIEIAKGKFELVTTLSEIMIQKKRQLKWLKKE